ncbi:universal stress protein [Nitrincola tapanii]|uniref:Universal stress protein n=1 Tax=Nitrincola tapanii TaxID=1708751 RepID=A0A5A9W093_9GAMM|nr:universal stress protein [Nitrincola tapanii]KAA0873639.1 universal stress protein [Nitrincola tapanii]
MFKKILLPIDMQDKETAVKALNFAAEYLTQPDAELHLLTVLPGYSMPVVASYFPKNAIDSALQVLKEELTLVVNETLPNLVSYQVHVAEGAAHKEIIKAAKKYEVDLIMMPSHNYSRMENILIGSVTSRVVERAKCSVLVIR